MARSIKNLMAAMLISISGYLAWTQALPAYSITSHLKARIDEKNSLLASRQEIIEKLAKLKDENNTRYNELQRLALVLPEAREIPEVIASIENIHSRSGVILPELSIRDGKGTEELGSLVFTVNDSGTYSQFVNVLNYLERNIRLYDIDKVEVVLPAESKDSGARDPKLFFKIEGQAYWLQASAKSARTSPAVLENE